ncbi:MAG: hypothetical protein HY000_12370 [Planctomycetes bacterium]|nr:hypothetical protein [Planctomycetota bacterium]
MERAQTEWRELVKNNFKDFSERLEKLAKGNQRAADFVKKWWDQRRTLVSDAILWWHDDKDLQKRWRQFEESPWEGEGFIGTKARLENLEAAAQDWKKWAENKSLAPAELEKQLAGKEADVPEKGRILRGWYGAANQVAWQLIPKSGTAKQGDGHSRRICVSLAADYGKDHRWGLETNHNYVGADKAGFTVPFDWRPGEPITVILEGEGGWSTVGVRPNLVSQTFDGPLALWLLAQTSAITDQGGGHTLSFEVPSCPGPPPSWKKSLPTALPLPTRSK